MALDVRKPATIQDVGAAATKLTAKIAPAFKSAKSQNGTVSFYTSSDTTGTAAFTFDFPEEIYLKQLGTQIVDDFTFDSGTYKGATNPNLNGKTVLTLAVSGDSDTVTYSFVDMSKVVDTYAASDTSINISDYKIKVNLDASSDNLLTLTSGGLMVDGSNIAASGAAKVEGATAGNIAVFDSEGGIVDSGYGIASNAEVTAYLSRIFPNT